MNAHLALQARVHDYEERDKDKANKLVMTIRHVQAAATTVERGTSNGDDKRNEGGHTSGEVWTESPHFLWGP